MSELTGVLSAIEQGQRVAPEDGGSGGDAARKAAV